MKFSFGKYKGTDISEVAKKDPNYIYWVYTNVHNLKPKEEKEIKAYAKTTSLEQWEHRCECLKMAHDELKEEFVGKRFYDGRYYWKFDKVSDTGWKLSSDPYKLYGGYVYDVSNVKNRMRPIDHGIIGYGYVTQSELDTLEKCSDEDFENNLEKVFNLFK